MPQSRLSPALPAYSREIARWALIVGLTMLLTATPLPGAPGDLDRTFGTNGAVTIRMGPEVLGDYPYGIGLQASGKIILSSFVTTSSYGMVQYHSNGTLDTGFGTNGVFLGEFPVTQRGIAMALQPDGHILQLDSRYAVARHNPDGSLNLNFVAPPFLGASDTSFTMAVDQNGRVVVGGYVRHFEGAKVEEDFQLIRYNNNGSIDSTFDFDGRVTTDFGDHDACTGIAFQNDGKIIAGGYSGDPGGTFLRSWRLARYNIDGTLDTSFSEDGKLGVAPSRYFSRPTVAIQPDGKIILGGTADNWMVLARFNTNGTPDVSFGNNGTVLFLAGPASSTCAAIGVQRDGKIVAVGRASADYQKFDVAVVRFESDGTPDTGFGHNGIVTTQAGSSLNSADALALQPDGKILVAARIRDGLYSLSAIFRYLGDSGPSISAQPTGQVVNIGANVTFTVTASGSSPLGYQWLHNGANIDGATNPSLSLTNVQISDAGTYSVVVSNHVGTAQSSNAVLRVNRIPIADAGATVRLVITSNSNSPVILDASRSSDPDGDLLTYRWLTAGDAQPIATGVVAIVTLARGAHPITLEVSDGIASDSDSVTVEVIDAEEGIRGLLAEVEGSDLLQGHKAPLEAHLRQAGKFVEDARLSVALIHLERFKAKVVGSVLESAPELARQWIAAADLIIAALKSAPGEASRLQRLIGLLAAAEISDNTRSVLETSLQLPNANHGGGGPNIAQLNEFMAACESELGTSDPQLCRLLTENAREAVLELRGDALRVCPTLNRELNRIELRFFGFAGERYCIACSTNLVDWQLLGVAREIEANDFYFEDAELDGRRFYRLVTP
jgi:uncharacterized delta-60 repeat protein